MRKRRGRKVRDTEGRTIEVVGIPNLGPVLPGSVAALGKAHGRCKDLFSRLVLARTKHKLTLQGHKLRFVNGLKVIQVGSADKVKASLV